MKTFASTGVVVAALLNVAGLAVAQPVYQIYDLGLVVAGDSASQGFGVSSGGVAVGRSAGSNRAFSWTVGGGLVGLPAVPGRAFAVGNDANDNGQVVGTGSSTFFGSSPLAVVWQGGLVAVLPLPAGQSFSRGNGINAAGTVVGSIGSGSGERATVWVAGAPTIVTATTPGGATMTTAYRVNDSGVAVGNGTDPLNLARNVGLAYDIGAGTLTEVPPLAGQNGAIAFDISQTGFIVGASSFNQASGLPFRWDAVGGSIPIPLPVNTTQGSARGVNSAGWVVGNASGAFSVPFLYDGTQTYRLQDLLPPGSPWDLSANTSSSALGISEDDMIVGTGVLGGQVRAYAMVRLVECQEPDLTTGAVPGQPGYGVPNGILNNDDFFYFLAQFAAGNLAVADITTTAVQGQPGYGVPDGIINNEDFFYYLALFAAGC